MTFPFDPQLRRLHSYRVSVCFFPPKHAQLLDPKRAHAQKMIRLFLRGKDQKCILSGENLPHSYLLPRSGSSRVKWVHTDPTPKIQARASCQFRRCRTVMPQKNVAWTHRDLERVRYSSKKIRPKCALTAFTSRLGPCRKR